MIPHRAFRTKGGGGQKTLIVGGVHDLYENLAGFAPKRSTPSGPEIVAGFFQKKADPSK